MEEIAFPEFKLSEMIHTYKRCVDMDMQKDVSWGWGQRGAGCVCTTQV